MSPLNRIIFRIVACLIALSAEGESLIDTEKHTKDDVVKGESSSATPGYAKIRASTLLIGSTILFDLYTLPEEDKSPVLYTRRNTAMTEDVHNNLANLQDNAVYIDEGDLNNYQGYMESNLTVILNANDLEMQEKMEVMYECAQRVTKSLFANTEALNLLYRARALVIAISNFVFRNDDIIKSFVKICNYNYSEATHCVNVLIYALCFLQRVGIRDVGWIQNFSTGVLLFDLGRNNVDKMILERNGPLNPSQWKVMKMHPVWSEEVLKAHGIIDEVILNIVCHHHEKLNGKGYPDGWRGDQIPQYVRIVTICDIFDALTTKRAYGDAVDSFSALKLMHEEMTGEIDSELHKVFVKMMS